MSVITLDNGLAYFGHYLKQCIRIIFYRTYYWFDPQEKMLTINRINACVYYLRIINWVVKNERQWKLNQHTKLCLKNTYENMICQMCFILFNVSTARHFFEIKVIQINWTLTITIFVIHSSAVLSARLMCEPTNIIRTTNFSLLSDVLLLVYESGISALVTCTWRSPQTPLRQSLPCWVSWQLGVSCQESIPWSRKVSWFLDDAFVILIWWFSNSNQG